MSRLRHILGWPGRLPFAAYPAGVLILLSLHLWVASGVSPFAAVRGMAVVVILGVALAAAGAALMRDRHRGGVVGLLLVLLVVAGGRPGIVPILLLAIAVLLVERYGPARLTLNWAWIGRLFGRGTAILALAVFFEAVQLGRLTDVAAAIQREGPLRTFTSAAPPADAPDVYVILLDGYARADIMRDRYGLDDSPFIGGLSDRGFEVASGSHSNYLITNLSLASFLNGRLIDEVPALAPLIADPSGVDGPPVYRAISSPAVVEDFRSIGYETVAISSGFEQVAVRGVDRFIDSGEVNEFEIQLLRPSVIPPVATALVPDVLSGQQRSRIESIMVALEGLAGEAATRPRFVFAHVPSPHAPWVSHADGTPRLTTNLEAWYWDTPETTGLTRAEIVDAYAGQSTYLGRRTLAAIDRVLSSSSMPPVIYVVSDHGSSLDVTLENAETRLRNLFAAYTPGRAGLHPDDATLVNLFPVLFDSYFGTDLGRSPETLFTEGPRGLFDPVPVAP